MSGFAQAVRRSNRLEPFKRGLENFVNNLQQESALDEFLKEVAGTKTKVGSRFDLQPNAEKNQMINNTETDPFLQFGNQFRRETALNNINATPNTVNDPRANQKAMGDIAEFVMQEIGKRRNLPEGSFNQALQGLDLFRQSKTTPEKKRNTVKVREGESVFDVETGKELFGRNKTEKPPTVESKFKGISARGYWSVEQDDQGNPSLKWNDNPNFKPSYVGGKEDNLPDYSKQLGDLNEAISKIKMMKMAKQDKSTGLYKVADPNSLGQYDLTAEELTTAKEQVKKQYSNVPITMITQQGLQNAVGDVKQILSKKGDGKPSLDDLDDALQQFKQLNPNYTDEDIRLLNDYFTFFLL
jgi:hypothetical protein